MLQVWASPADKVLALKRMNAEKHATMRAANSKVFSFAYVSWYHAYNETSMASRHIRCNVYNRCGDF